jgi:hypothetical protein
LPHKIFEISRKLPIFAFPEERNRKETGKRSKHRKFLPKIELDLKPRTLQELSGKEQEREPRGDAFPQTLPDPPIMINHERQSHPAPGEGPTEIAPKNMAEHLMIRIAL